MWNYSPFLIVEAKGDKLTGSSGFNNVTGWVVLYVTVSANMSNGFSKFLVSQHPTYLYM